VVKRGLISTFIVRDIFLPEKFQEILPKGVHLPPRFLLYCRRTFLRKFQKILLEGPTITPYFLHLLREGIFAKIFARKGDIYPLFFSMFVEGNLFEFFRSTYLKKAAFFSIYYERKFCRTKFSN